MQKKDEKQGAEELELTEIELIVPKHMVFVYNSVLCRIRTHRPDL